MLIKLKKILIKYILSRKIYLTRKRVLLKFLSHIKYYKIMKFFNKYTFSLKF